jgi:outer membrane receptor protein involved in Fe transport
MCKRKIYFILILLIPNTLQAQEHPTGNDSLALARQSYSLQNQLLGTLPFRGEVQEYYKLFPGAATLDYRGKNELHIRGSRHDEIGYFFEGVDVRSAFTGRNLFRFIPEALESIRLQNAPAADVGFAPSLAQHRLRRGGAELAFTLQSESDRFTPDYQKRLDTYSYGYADYVLTAEGKILKDNYRFFVAGERESFNDHYRKFWDGFTFSRPEARDYESKKTLRELIGVDEIAVQPGNIPQAQSSRYALNGIVTAQVGRVNLRAIGLFDRLKRQRNDTPIRNLFNPLRIPETKEEAGVLSLQMDYHNSRLANVHLQIDDLKSNAKTYDPLFEDDFLLYRDSLAIVEKGVPWAMPPDSYRYGDTYFQGPGQFRYFAFPFSRPGELLADYEKWQDDARGISGSLQKKQGEHEITIGGSWQRRTLRRFKIHNLLSFMNELRKIENEPEAFSSIEQKLRLREAGNVQAIGYDVFGEQIASASEANDAPRHPQITSFFIVDRFRAGDLQLTLGLRYDIFATDALIFKDPFEPEFNYGRATNIPLSSMQAAPKHSLLSPRFNAIFFADDRLQMRIDFGTYAQQPQFSQVHADRAYRVWAIQQAGNFNLEPRALDAGPVKSTQMTFGLAYQFQPDFHLDARLFHKTTDGYLQVDHIRTVDNFQFLVLDNSGESVARGAEASLEYRHGEFNAWLSYTFSAVHGLQSYPLSNLGDYLYSFSREQNFGTGPYTPLELQQSHTGNILLSYRLPGSLPLGLRNTGFSALLQFNSGHPYTLREAGDALG